MKNVLANLLVDLQVDQHLRELVLATPDVEVPSILGLDWVEEVALLDLGAVHLEHDQGEPGAGGHLLLQHLVRPVPEQLVTQEVALCPDAPLEHVNADVADEELVLEVLLEDLLGLALTASIGNAPVHNPGEEFSLGHLESVRLKRS